MMRIRRLNVRNNDPTQVDTETLIKAMRHLADNIYSEDGTANAAIAEAADRLFELQAKCVRLEADNRRLHMVIEDLQCGN